MLSRPIDRRRLLVAASGLALTKSAFAEAPHEAEDDLQVRIENKSAPELCAEKDNIELDFVSPRVRAMRVQAIHPSYIGMIGSDRWAPDWTSCDLSHDPKFAADARRLTFWETPEFWLVGYTFPSFWRPNDVPIRVGDRVEKGFHLVQLWMLYRERAEEILVFYPPDGYWRARPLPFEDMRWTAYGSSFLIGPVETQERPIVALQSVIFDPQTRSFTLSFKRGGEARLRIASIDQDRIVLDVSYSDAMPDNLPFASLRSMYTTQSMSDAALVAWRAKRGNGWQESPVIGFRGAPATEIWVGRHMPSRHNLSAPDMVFGRFRAAATTASGK
ncbi:MULTISPECIES: hypothetical protein [Methylosinus]|uniref:Uncharacterized protein n=1 Tax=Methylosinus trichosporium (strain ATCC 35070 / NCIMB 11131 / UNIQEM 75 / OB3b) TaxID=595536 RepID=A0A2D2D0D9_METT3|nr:MULTISPECIES: hypothetical protein [Methylosinus]ATQ68446.1 hypothetical protein CQW49_11570 [Methylosinus trichosporium OB3b]OBS51319.1 hypothetical protein A8B73_16640 [Methylosinus sp. 3S-1]